MQGKIIKIISNLYTVETDAGKIDCRARGKFRRDKMIPLVGDKCIIDFDNKYILEISPRKNFLTRPMIANIDAALIVTSVKEPKLSLNLLDKMICIIEHHEIEPILCFTKLDLLNKEEKKEILPLLNYYQKVGYKVLLNTDIEELKKFLKKKVVVVTGQTGAGKSTLLNRLDPTLALKTDEISKSLGRGRHTTRHVELFQFDDFYIADTPGFSSLDIEGLTKEEIRNGFLEFQNYPCPFKDCNHVKEKNCTVKDAVLNKEILESRYQNYIHFITRR